MNPAPAISSILAPAYLAEFAMAQYGLGRDATCQILKTGINHSYLLEASHKKYVLRVYCHRWRTEHEIAAELRLLEHLAEQGVLVSCPIKDVAGNYLQRLPACEGERMAVLFSFAEGEAIRNPSEEVCHQLGVSMAKMHQATLCKTIDRKNYDAETLVRWAFELAKGYFPEDSHDMQYFKRAHARISSEFQNAAGQDLRYGAVHLDLWYENMRIQDASKITFFDFDNCGNGWLLLDVAYSLLLLFRNEPDKTRYMQKREGFFRGYESVAPISPEEKKLLPFAALAIWLHYTGVHVQRFNDFSNIGFRRWINGWRSTR